MESKKPYSTQDLIDTLTRQRTSGTRYLINDDQWIVEQIVDIDNVSVQIKLVREPDNWTVFLDIVPSEFPDSLGSTEEEFDSPVLFRISVALMEFANLFELSDFENESHVTLKQRQPQIPLNAPSPGEDGYYWDGR